MGGCVVVVGGEVEDVVGGCVDVVVAGAVVVVAGAVVVVGATVVVVAGATVEVVVVVEVGGSVTGGMSSPRPTRGVPVHDDGSVDDWFPGQLSRCIPAIDTLCSAAI